MRYLFLFLISVFFSFLDIRAQAGKDSVIISQVRAAFFLSVQNPDSAIAIADKALSEAKISNNKRLAAYAYKAKGWALKQKTDNDSAFADLLLSAELFHQLGETHEEILMYLNLGVAYSNRSQFSSCAKYIFIADSLAQKIDDKRVQSEVKRQMGILYREQGQYAKAILNFRESMQIYLSIRDSLHFLDAVTSLSIVYMQMSMPDSSLIVLHLCNPLEGFLKNLTYQRALLRERYGDAYFALNLYAKALESYVEALKIFTLSKNSIDLAYETMNVGKTYTKLKNFPQAQKYLMLSYHLNDSLKIINDQRDGAYELAELYRVTGDWPHAYEWLNKTKQLDDSINVKDQNEKTAQLQAKYEADKKDKEIDLLKKDRELNQVIVQRRTSIQYGAVVLSGLLAVISLLILSRYRSAQKSKRAIEMEKIRNHIARDLHDDMGSALSSINIISKVAMENASEKTEVNEHFRKIHQNSGYILENMSDIVWTINPGNDSLEMVLLKMKEFAANVLDPLNILFEFKEYGSFRDRKLELQERRDLYLVFKEAVNNIAKHSGCTQVQIKMEATDRQIQLQIKDNGQGFSMNNSRNGNGLRNMKERALQIKAQLNISSEVGQGTEVILIIKSHH